MSLDSKHASSAQSKPDPSAGGVSRREFLKAGALVSAGASLAAIAGRAPGVFAAGSDRIRVGLIGCGGRGLYDSGNCLKAAPGVELVAMGDMFPDRLQKTLDALRKAQPDKVKVTPETCFTGFDAYKKVLACDVDLVLMCQVPHFRAQHLRAAVEAGKHVFIEKPVAVDPVGVRSVIESAEMAEKKNLTILAGTQARRMEHRIEVIKRIHDGDIGDIRLLQCVRQQGGMTDWGMQERAPGMSDIEWQIRRWLFYVWGSGDFISEMHVHELDICNWIMNGVPEKCYAMGGRQTRVDPKFGDVYDHFSGDFEYAGGARLSYWGSQIDKCSSRNFERVIGTKGVAYTDWSTSKIEGPKPWAYEGKMPDPCLMQHADQIKAIRENLKLNEGRRVAESSMVSILCRISAYCAQELSWNWVMKASKLDLSPAKYELGPLPEPKVAIPGKTPLV
ncbi:MAG: Gfo/Idh/MocA family oxidoreductase [Candidatus Sumerlaeota bacterium]|nr:Gfo/Idh/MocA family oxidoreductase [Candidatus Sumerlaeota bacterium]